MNVFNVMESESNKFKEIVKEFLESKPLYVRQKLPDDFHYVEPDVLFLFCNICKSERPFRDIKPIRGNTNDPKPYSGNSISPSVSAMIPSTPATEFYKVKYTCTGCNNDTFDFWFQLNYKPEKWLKKIGQLPMWIPAISKELKEAFGSDADLYAKALRNMNEGYGIGACAYLRRLVEKYINPLLELLHDVKQEQGESAEKLAEIKEAIQAKDFTSKTKFASEIAPAAIIVKGHNPLKEIHERLSIGLHTLDEETALQYAIFIKNALEFIIPRLRREFDDRKEYTEMIKGLRNLPT